jgi:molybdopterin synthase sulfur carrier subunit
MVQLRYFASLRETLGIGEEQVELPAGVRDVSELTHWLQSRDSAWNNALSDQRIHVAVNHEIARADMPVSDGDEVAWFPPVTGG